MVLQAERAHYCVGRMQVCTTVTPDECSVLGSSQNSNFLKTLFSKASSFEKREVTVPKERTVYKAKPEKILFLQIETKLQGIKEYQFCEEFY